MVGFRAQPGGGDADLVDHTILVTEAVLNVYAVLLSLESEREEILLMRNDHPVARLVPEPESMDTIGVFGDLHGTLDDETASKMLRGIEIGRSSGNMKQVNKVT
ncbi:MAG: hypothetical protein IPK32_07615 [Verrucomicrobiaceae bacterium]|nr:hypothetical protein [Verrucomicrobiaceae bacterium]